MVQSIFEEMGGRYERQGEYILPCLTIPPEKEQPIDLFGRRHLDYLREYRKITYTNLLTSGRLNAYLADIDRQAQERFERLIEGMKQAQGITEQLKAENALKWTGRMNNITLYGHYVHPKAELGLSVNVSSYGSFSISGGSNYDERGSQKTISW